MLAALLCGCADSSSPPGPGDGVPVFDVALLPDEIQTPGGAALVTLTPRLSLEFRELHGRPALLRSALPAGTFNPEFSAVDTLAPSGLNPQVQYLHGEAADGVDTVYVYCVAILGGDTLAWNYGTVRLTSGP